MSFLENLPYKTSCIIKDKLKTRNQSITLSRYFCESDKYDRYYLRAMIKENNETYPQGFLYFYLNPDRQESKFVGVGIEEAYRNLGIASLLIASWIDLSFNEGFTNLNTNVRQRKPFVLHMLKKYSFELNHLDTYLTSDKTVHICKIGDNYNHKYISFNSIQEERRFRTSNIMKTDNYEIVSKDDEGVEIIDSVVLCAPYVLQDKDTSYQKVLQIYQKHL